MDFPILTIADSDPLFPPYLREIPEFPRKVYVRGTLPQNTKYLAVVGSRNYTDYGRRAVETLIGGLRGFSVTIVSGLALGIDALAHEAALRAGLSTVAVPGSGIDDGALYPRRNRPLAYRILEAGGALFSEFEPQFKATTWSFPKRNRIMAGLSHAVLLIEATEKSGTLITARLATEYNRDLLAVPGSIFSDSTRGTHQFLKLGATMVTGADDILGALNIPINEQGAAPGVLHSPEQDAVLAILSIPMERDALIRSLPYQVDACAVLLMEMELEGLITEQNGMVYKIE